MASVIITGAGYGSRANLGYNKTLYLLNGETVIEKVFKIFYNCNLFN